MTSTKTPKYDFYHSLLFAELPLPLEIFLDWEASRGSDHAKYMLRFAVMGLELYEHLARSRKGAGVLAMTFSHTAEVVERALETGVLTESAVWDLFRVCAVKPASLEVLEKRFPSPGFWARVVNQQPNIFHCVAHPFDTVLKLCQKAGFHHLVSLHDGKTIFHNAQYDMTDVHAICEITGYEILLCQDPAENTFLHAHDYTRGEVASLRGKAPPRLFDVKNKLGLKYHEKVSIWSKKIK